MKSIEERAEADPTLRVCAPWWLWRHNQLRHHTLTIDGDYIRCSCGGVARARIKP